MRLIVEGCESVVTRDYIISMLKVVYILIKTYNLSFIDTISVTSNIIETKGLDYFYDNYKQEINLCYANCETKEDFIKNFLKVVFECLHHEGEVPQVEPLTPEELDKTFQSFLKVKKQSEEFSEINYQKILDEYSQII